MVSEEDQKLEQLVAAIVEVEGCGGVPDALGLAADLAGDLEDGRLVVGWAAVDAEATGASAEFAGALFVVVFEGVMPDGVADFDGKGEDGRLLLGFGGGRHVEMQCWRWFVVKSERGSDQVGLRWRWQTASTPFAAEEGTKVAPAP